MNAPARPRGLKRRLAVLLAAVVVVAGLAWYGKTHLSLDQLVAMEQRVREAIEQQPWQSFGTGLAIYAVVSLIPGTSGKSIVFAWLYGFSQGLIIILAGLTIAATVMFSMSRYVFRDWIEHHYGPFLDALNQHLKKEGAFYLLTLRMAHFPYSIINFASGASRVHLHTFCWTTILGLLPGTAIFAWVGIRLPSLDQLAEQGVESLVDPALIAILAASAAFPFVFRFCARKLGILSVTAIDDDETPDDQPPVIP